MVAVDEVCRPGRPARRSNERVQLIFIHRRVYAFSPRHTLIFFKGVKVSFIRQRPFRFRPQKNLLAEVRHLFISILFVELDGLFQRMDGSFCS